MGLFSRFSRDADVAARNDGLYAARFTRETGEDVIVAPYGSQTARLRLERRLGRPHEVMLFASSNDNDRYRLLVTYREARHPEMAVLLVDGIAIVSTSSRVGNGQAVFELGLDRKQADDVARILEVARTDRSSHGEHIEATFTATSGSLRRDGPMVIVVRIENPKDAPPVQIETGGFRLFFVAHRGSECVAETEPGISTAPVFFRALAAGGVIEDHIDLAGRWLHTPGRHVIACRYETRFAEVGVDPFGSPAGSALVWDRTFVGSVALDIL